MRAMLLTNNIVTVRWTGRLVRDQVIVVQRSPPIMNVDVDAHEIG